MKPTVKLLIQIISRKYRQNSFSLLLLCLTVLIFTSSTAAAESGKWRFALGYGFLSNTDDVKDAYKHRLKAAGNGDDVYDTSIRLSFQPYYQLENGCRAGAGVGPLIILAGDAWHVQVPLNLTAGYSFLMDSEISPYVRAGISYHIASGDFYADSSPGFYGGIGVELFNTRPAHLGFEAAYDAASITLDSEPGRPDSEKIKTGEVIFYLYADF